VKVLIIGSSGQVGNALLRAVPPRVEVQAPGRQQLDLRDCVAIERTVKSFRPELIINAGAYTQVDKAETEPELALAINAVGPRQLAETAHAIPNCRLLHVSTDYVFDGQAKAPYQPADATNPLNVYGQTKLRGEQAVLEVLSDRAVVLRTAWIYAAEGRNFLLTMLRLMRERGAVRVVNDQRGTPTEARSIARALWQLAALPRIGGILHWTDEGVVSWYEFACAIAEDARAAGLLSSDAQVTPISSAEYPTPARRPAMSILDLRDSIVSMKLQPTRWRDSLRATLAALRATGAYST
jgi:dTDP-4-dehydrorhamnose reductase